MNDDIRSLAVSIEWTMEVESLFATAGVLGVPIDLGERDGQSIEVRLRGFEPTAGETQTWLPVTNITATVRTFTRLRSLARDWSQRTPDAAEEAEATRLRVAAAAAMNSAVTDFFDYLGMSYGWSRARVTAPHVGGGKLIAEGVRLDFGGPPAEITLVARERGVNPTEVAAIATWLRDGMKPGTGWKLYLDARRRWENEEDVRGTIVEAAAAIEVGAAEAFRRVAMDKNLLEISLQGARVKELLTKLSQAVLTVSLAEHDQATYRQILGLVEDRNAFAHRGEVPQAGRIPGYLEAVRKTLHFFDSAASARAAELGLDLLA